LLPASSAFDALDTAHQSRGYFERRVSESPTKASWRRRLPALGRNRRAPEFAAAATAAISALLNGSSRCQGLILGAGERGSDQAGAFPGVDWLLTDVDLSYGADAAVDGTRLPLPDGSIDVVLISHVLEHVIDPIAGAREIERVLRTGGLVIATIPFSFPWHGVPLDFFRVTPSGMRALFRGCEVEYLAAGMGNGSALSYGASTALVSRSRNRWVRWGAHAVARTAVSPLKHLDRIESRTLASSGFAAEIQFIGRRAEQTLSDAEILADLRSRFG
jgi:SAM-dependent methyltransferase